MGFYIGNEPAKVAIKVGQGVITSVELGTDSVTTIDILNDAVTPTKIDESSTGYQVGSLGVGTAVSGGDLLKVGGSVSITSSLSVSNTINALDELSVSGDFIAVGGEFSAGVTGTTLALTGALTGTSATFSGNVGIGTTPLGKLHLSGTTLVDSWMSDTGAAADTKRWSWQVGSAVGTGVMRLRALNDANSSGINAIEFARTGISSISTSIMGGNVGIGTTSPGAMLEIIHPDTKNNHALEIDSEESGAYSVLFLKGKNALSIQSDISGGYGAHISRNIDEAGSMPLASFIDDHASNTQTTLVVRQDGTGYAATFNGGNVGIGTSSPDLLLDVENTTAGVNPLMKLGYADAVNSGGYLSFGGTGASNEYGRIESVIDGSGEVSMRFYDYEGATLTEVMRIDGGKVGIGTTENLSRFTVKGASSAVEDGIAIQGSADTTRWALLNVSSANDLAIGSWNGSAFQTNVTVENITGNATFSGDVTHNGWVYPNKGIRRGLYTGWIGDNTVSSYSLNTYTKTNHYFGMIMVHVYPQSYGAILAVNNHSTANTSNIVSQDSNNLIEVGMAGTSTKSGTDATDGKVKIWLQQSGMSDPKIYIVNRVGGDRVVQLTFINFNN